MGRSNRTRGTNEGVIFFLLQKKNEFIEGMFTDGSDYMLSWEQPRLDAGKAKIKLVSMVANECGGLHIKNGVSRQLTELEIPYIFFNAQKDGIIIQSVEEYQQMRVKYDSVKQMAMDSEKEKVTMLSMM